MELRHSDWIFIVDKIGDYLRMNFRDSSFLLVSKILSQNDLDLKSTVDRAVYELVGETYYKIQSIRPAMRARAMAGYLSAGRSLREGVD